MGGLLIALAGLWLLGTGYHENGSPASTFVLAQKEFLAWLIAAAILYALAQVKTIRPAVIAITALALLAIVVHQWPTITAQWANVSAGSATASSATAPSATLTTPLG